MWAEVSSLTPHFLHKGLSSKSSRYGCLLRVLWPVRRPVTALDWVLLKVKNLALAHRLGPEMNSRTCLWVSPRPHHWALCWLTNQRTRLFCRSRLETTRAGSGPRNLRAEPPLASPSEISLPRIPDQSMKVGPQVNTFIFRSLKKPVQPEIYTSCVKYPRPELRLL